MLMVYYSFEVKGVSSKELVSYLFPCIVQIRRSLLNEDEYGFRRAKQPIYYDEGLEVITFYSPCIFSACWILWQEFNIGLPSLFCKKQKTRKTLNAKISQLNSAIDKVSSRLRGGNNSPRVPLEADPEMETTMWDSFLFVHNNFWDHLMFEDQTCTVCLCRYCWLKVAFVMFKWEYEWCSQLFYWSKSLGNMFESHINSILQLL